MLLLFIRTPFSITKPAGIDGCSRLLNIGKMEIYAEERKQSRVYVYMYICLLPRKVQMNSWLLKELITDQTRYTYTPKWQLTINIVFYLSFFFFFQPQKLIQAGHFMSYKSSTSSREWLQEFEAFHSLAMMNQDATISYLGNLGKLYKPALHLEQWCWIVVVSKSGKPKKKKQSQKTRKRRDKKTSPSLNWPPSVRIWEPNRLHFLLFRYQHHRLLRRFQCSLLRHLSTANIIRSSRSTVSLPEGECLDKKRPASCLTLPASSAISSRVIIGSGDPHWLRKPLVSGESCNLSFRSHQFRCKKWTVGPPYLPPRRRRFKPETSAHHRIHHHLLDHPPGFSVQKLL